MPKRKKLGLVLGPGFDRAWLHAGVLKRLEELEIVPDLIVGTSAGSMMGLIPATGSSMQKLYDHRKLWDFTFGTQKNLDTNFGLYSNQPAIDALKKMFPGVKTFEDLKIPLYVVATDYITYEEKIFSQGEIWGPIAGSTAFPIFYTPVKVGGLYYTDGGIANPAPIDIAREKGADYVIFVNISPKDELKMNIDEIEKQVRLKEQILKALPYDQATKFSSPSLIFAAGLRIKELAKDVYKLITALKYNQRLVRDELHKADIDIDLEDIPGGGNITLSSKFSDTFDIIEWGYDGTARYVDQLQKLKRKLETENSVKHRIKHGISTIRHKIRPAHHVATAN